MRAVTFNIHHGVGIDGRLDLDGVESVIEELRPDVIGLQEVDRRFGERSGFIDQARTLSRRLGMRLAFGAALDLDPSDPGRPRRRYGNAVLSTHPIVGRQNTLLPRTAAVEPRALLRAAVELDGQPIDVYVTHLEAHHPSQRTLQAAAVATTISGRRNPCVLLADLNVEPDDPEMASINAVLEDAWQIGRGAGRTHPAHKPRRRIDVVMHSAELRPITAAVVGTVASDHRPVLVGFDEL